jgi:CubicO group peptidase (beta-lactamase class C family)
MQRLGRVQDVARRFVENGQLAGVASLVWRRGEIISSVAEGWADIDAKVPLRRDTIFRIASMTKPIISVAALMLLEDGRLTLNDPLTRWLPETANLRVLRGPDAELDDTVPLDRPPTLHDLITHRAGFAGPLLLGAGTPVVKALSEATGQVAGASPFIQLQPDELVARVCAVPLMMQPGWRWHYGISTDLLGVVIARASGMSLPDFLASRIFGPLAMVDTGFFVPPEKRDRLAIGYARGEPLVVYDHPATGQWSKPPIFPAGGGGLASTLDDYLAFARMLLAGGTIGKERLLSRSTIAMMTAPHLTVDQMRPLHPALDILAGRNFGLGVSIHGGAGPELGSPGKYGWSGVYGTDWFNDPAEDLICIVMSQLWYSGSELRPAFANAVYQAIDD